MLYRAKIRINGCSRDVGESVHPYIAYLKYLKAVRKAEGLQSVRDIMKQVNLA